jgi:hypothetical protein
MTPFVLPFARSTHRNVRATSRLLSSPTRAYTTKRGSCTAAFSASSTLLLTLVSFSGLNVGHEHTAASLESRLDQTYFIRAFFACPAHPPPSRHQFTSARAKSAEIGGIIWGALSPVSSAMSRNFCAAKKVYSPESVWDGQFVPQVT